MTKRNLYVQTCANCVQNLPNADTLGHEIVPTVSPEKQND